MPSPISTDRPPLRARRSSSPNCATHLRALGLEAGYQIACRAVLWAAAAEFRQAGRARFGVSARRPRVARSPPPTAAGLRIAELPFPAPPAGPRTAGLALRIAETSLPPLPTGPQIAGPFLPPTPAAPRIARPALRIAVPSLSPPPAGWCGAGRSPPATAAGHHLAEFPLPA